MLPGIIRRMLRRGSYRENFGERLGRYAPELRASLAGSGASSIWICSVSVGETLLALRLAEQLRRDDPAARIVLSVTTSTGRAVAEKPGHPWLRIIYNPLDFPPCVRAAFRAIRPARIVFIEAAPWPNIAARAHRLRIPVALVNARISPRSERRYRSASWLVRPLFKKLDLVCVADPEDIALWRHLGAPAAAIHCTGNIKFDHTPAGPGPRVETLREILNKLSIPANAPILLAGSTFPGEEAIIGRAFIELRQTFPSLFLIAAPRHVERSADAARDLASAGLSVVRRTALDVKSNPETKNFDALLIDTTGELRDWYALATVVFIGKSLGSTGGQNPVEAVLAGAPVVFGPHMENFAAIVRQWLAADAALQIPGEAQLAPALSRLIADPALRAAMTARAQAAIAAHTGATARASGLVVGIGACQPR